MRPGHLSRPFGLALLAVVLAGPGASPLSAQDDPGIKLAVGDVGIGIGDVPRIDGIRLNFRDLHLERVRGLNLTIWEPHEESRGVVRGLALGLPLTGAREIDGVVLGAGIAVEEEFTGIAAAPLGLGAGGRVRGIAVAGLGLGSGGGVDGIVVGGLGAGTGGSVRGVAVGGLGFGVGGDVDGVVVGGVGLGVGGSFRGIAAGGVGVGAGGDAAGLLVGGVGAGAGSDLTGIAVGGIGVGVGGRLTGLAVGGVGVGADRVRGLTLSGIGAGARRFEGVAVASAYFRIEEEGLLRGVSVAAFNDIRGRQHGLTIGLLNIAEELHGLQIGLLNIARNKERFSVLPLMNYHP